MTNEINTGSIINEKYKILRLLGRGGMGSVWLAENISTRENVAIKIINEKLKNSHLKKLLFFKKEADILQGLDHPQIARLIEFDFFESSFFIAMEYLEGSTLQQYLNRNRHFQLDVFLDIAIQLSEIIAYIHNRNILHSDIKPNNIILQQTGESITVKILDFGISLLLPVEINAFHRSAGTCSYISPEQSGFIRRKIDHRSDLYSLGIIFYHMLTGKLPYSGENVFKLIHNHIATQPDPITEQNPEVPAILESLIFKLLSKDPEGRYPDGLLLIEDLKRIRDMTEKGVETINLELSQQRFDGKGYISIPFTGRIEETKLLQEAFVKALHNEGSIILISGESGIGKTHLVERFQEYVIRNEGVFISVNNHEYDQNIPLNSINGCLSHFFDIISLYPDNKKKKVIERINNNLGNTSNLIANTIPGIKRLISHSQQVEDLSDNAERKRFENVLLNTLFSLSDSTPASVLFIDNIQWADLGSLQFIQNFSRFAGKYNILLIANLRTPLNKSAEQEQFVQEIFKAHNTKHLAVPPLTRSEIRSILIPFFGDNKKNIEFMADSLLHKTGGNIQYIKEILLYLNKKSLLNSERRLDDSVFNEVGLSENRLELIKESISGFSAETHKLLSYMAVFGREVPVSDLFECFSDIEKDCFINTINTGTQADVIQLRENKILFSHGAFQKLFYEELSEKTRKRIHNQAAGFFERRNEDHSRVFQLAYHYSKTDNVKKSLYYLTLAGDTALQNKSYTDALSWFNKADSLVFDNMIEEGEIRKIKKGLAYANSFMGRNNEAKKYFSLLIKSEEKNIEKSDLLFKMGNCQIDEGDFEDAVITLRQAYACLGSSLPSNLNLQILREFFIHSVMNRKKKSFLHAEIDEDDLIGLRQLKIIERLDFIGFWTGDTSMILYNHFKSMNICRQQGPTSETLRLLCLHMAILISVPLPPVLFAKVKLSIDRYLHKGGMIYGMIKETRPSKFLFKAVEAGLLLFLDGDISTSLGIIRETMESFWQERNIEFLQEITSIYSQILEASNEFEELIQLGEKTEELAMVFENPIISTYAKTYKGMGLLYMGEINQARFLLENACFDFQERNDKVFFAIAGKYLVKAFYQDGMYPEGNRFYKELSSFLKKNSLSHPAFFGVHAFFAESEALRNIKSGIISGKISAEIKEALCELKRGVDMFVFLKSQYLNASLIFAASKGNLKACRSLVREAETFYRFRNEPYGKGMFHYYNSFCCSDAKKRETLEKAYLLLNHCQSETFLGLIEQYIEKDDYALVDESLKGNADDEYYSSNLKTSRELDLIIDIGKKIGTIHELTRLFDEILDQSMELVGAEQGEIFLKEGDELVSKSRRNLKPVAGIPSCLGMIQIVKEKQVPCIVSDASRDPVYKHDPDVLKYELKSILCVPIVSNNKFLGLVYLSNHQVGNLFTDHELDMMSSLAVEAGIMIENTLLLNSNRELTTQMENIINSITTGIIAVNKNAEVLLSNQVMDSYIPKTDPRIAASKKYWSLYPELKESRELFQRVIENFSLYEEKEIRIGNRFFLLGVSPLNGDSLYGAVIKLNDITDARKNQEHMVQVQKMETVSTMVGGLAHDFNNTLTGITASSNYLKNFVINKPDPDLNEISESMDTITKAVNRASDLVNQLLTFSMKKEVLVVPVDLNTVVEQSVKVSEKLLDRRIDVKISLPENQVVIMADSAQLEQVLLNLIINASHAMTIMRSKREDWGGILSIVLESTIIDEVEKMKILHLENGKYWRLAISDTGVGMSQEVKDKIFEPFFTTKRSGEGTGLGLAMVYSIIRRLNGYLEVYSELDKGSVFNLYFPIQDNSFLSEESEEEINREAIEGNLNILIAEDENILRVAIAKSLESCGFTVFQSQNGREALDYYKKNYEEIDLVILDMVMPEMTGHEAFFAMKEINPDMVAILTSGFRKDERVEDLLNNGVNYFLQKPYGQNELFRSIELVRKEMKL